MYIPMYVNKTPMIGNGYRGAIRTWINLFKTRCEFRKQFLLLFYTALLLFRTLLNRNLWLNPIMNIVGDWGLYSIDPNTGQCILSTECIENILLFLPLAFLLLWNRQRSCLDIKVKFTIIWTLKVSFVLSISIEMLQLLLRLGTVQLSDVFLNVLGGLLGAILYIAVNRIVITKGWKKDDD